MQILTTQQRQSDMQGCYTLTYLLTYEMRTAQICHQTDITGMKRELSVGNLNYTSWHILASCHKCHSHMPKGTRVDNIALALRIISSK